MKRDPHQLDLLEWAAKRPTATVIRIIPGVVKRIWRERGRPRTNRGGKPVAMPLRRRRTA